MYAELGLSKAAYDEISRKLREADYRHAFMDNGTIDMHGIGVTCEEKDDTDQVALDAANLILKACVDNGNSHPKTKAAIQVIVAGLLRKCRTS